MYYRVSITYTYTIKQSDPAEEDLTVVDILDCRLNHNPTNCEIVELLKTEVPGLINREQVKNIKILHWTVCLINKVEKEIIVKE